MEKWTIQVLGRALCCHAEGTDVTDAYRAVRDKLAVTFGRQKNVARTRHRDGKIQEKMAFVSSGRKTRPIFAMLRVARRQIRRVDELSDFFSQSLQIERTQSAETLRRR